MILAAYHAAHSCSAGWCLLVPALVCAMTLPPFIARGRGWGDDTEA